MGPIVSLLVIAAVSLIIVRIGSTALMLTGLSWDVASFQAYSSFFGVGFTTAEAELAVSTPHRRRIIKHLILIGNIGLTAGLGSVIVAFVKADGLKAELNVLAWILGALICLGLLTITPPVRRAVDWIILSTLKRSGVVNAADYGLLLRLHAGYAISELAIQPNSHIAGRTLAETKLGTRGVVVLGIQRRAKDIADQYIGTPNGDTIVLAHDLLTVYGQPAKITDLLCSAATTEVRK